MWLKFLFFLVHVFLLESTFCGKGVSVYKVRCSIRPVLLSEQIYKWTVNFFFMSVLVYLYIQGLLSVFVFFLKLVLAISVLLSKFKGNRLKGCKQKDYFFLCPPFYTEQDSFFNPSFSSELTNWHLGIQNYKTFHL